MSGDPLLKFWSSPHDVASCIQYGMCECEEPCDQSRVRKGEPTYTDLLERIEWLEMQLLQWPTFWSDER